MSAVGGSPRTSVVGSRIEAACCTGMIGARSSPRIRSGSRRAKFDRCMKDQACESTSTLPTLNGRATTTGAPHGFSGAQPTQLPALIQLTQPGPQVLPGYQSQPRLLTQF